MPIIPLPTRSAPLPNAPNAVLDRERRPTVDNRGVMQAVGQLANAQAAVKVDGRAMAAPYEALGAIGEAIARTGSVFEALAERRAVAEGHVQVADSDRDSDIVMAEHEAWRLKNSAQPATWEADIAARLGKLRTQLLDAKGLQPAAREQISLRFTRFDGQARARVMADAAREIFTQAKSGFLATAERATQTRDREKYDAARTMLAEHGYAYPHELEKLDQRFLDVGEGKKKEEKQLILQRADLLLDTGDTEAALKQLDTLAERKLAEPETISTLKVDAQRRGEILDWQRQVDTDPLKTQERLAGLLDAKGKASAGTQLTPEQIVRLQQQGATTINVRRRDLFSQAVDLIETGHMVSDEQAGQFGQGYFREIDIERLGQKRREIEGPSAEERVQLARDIANYRGAGDVEQEQLTDLNSRIRLMPEGFRQQFRDQLNEAIRPDTSVANAMTKLLSLRMEMGAFGNVSKKDGKPIDAESYRAAHERAAELQYQFRAWAKENPKASLEQSRQWLIDNTQADARAAAVNAKGWFRWLTDKLPSGKSGSAGHFQNEVDRIKERRDAIIATHGGLDESLIGVVKGFEGFRPKAYGDYKQTSVGYGTRAKSESETLTPAEADVRLRDELRGHARGIDTAAGQKGWKLTKNQREALISFDFNTGAGAELLQSSTTLAEVRQRMALYTKVTEDGRKVFNAGLDRRRKAEVALFNK